MSALDVARQEEAMLARPFSERVLEPHRHLDPFKVRIVKDRDMIAYEGEAFRPWQMDGVDYRRRLCTELVWNFASHAEAVAALPEFCRDASDWVPNDD